MKTIGFYPAHPSQVWMMKALSESAPEGICIRWYARDKDVCLGLMQELGIEFKLMSVAGSGMLGNGLELLASVPKFIAAAKRDNIDLWLSKYGAVNFSAWLLGKRNISFNDDDADVVPFIARTSYPFANRVLCTNWTRMGAYEDKARRYSSFHELFYLHPKRFQSRERNPVMSVGNKPYILIRLSSLKAHHDLHERGMADSALEQVISILEPQYSVFISSEKPLRPEYEPYRLEIPVSEIHPCLAGASLVIGDSQTMMAEAAVLGVRSIRISSFIGRLSYIEELGRRGLCFSLSPEKIDELPALVNSVLEVSSEEMNRRRDLLIKETVDPVDFFWDEIMQELYR